MLISGSQLQKQHIMAMVVHPNSNCPRYEKQTVGADIYPAAQQPEPEGSSTSPTCF